MCALSITLLLAFDLNCKKFQIKSNLKSLNFKMQVKVKMEKMGLVRFYT